MNIAEIGRAWEGRMLDARLPLRQWLGNTNHSCVYLTEIAGPKSPKVVVKIFPADFFKEDHQLSRWRALAQLNSPYLLRVLDGGRSEIDNTPFFFVVTDFAEEDLGQILPQRALTPDEVEELLPPVLEGLAYLHKNGFVHGHIQPSNIMAMGDKLKLPVDRVYTTGEPRDNTSPLTPYDAPETAAGALTPAADVWSLGMFLVAALKQRPLAVAGNPSAAPKIPGDIPEPLRSIISDCLVLEPKNRSTIAEIGAWLQPTVAVTSTASAAAAKPAPVAKSAPAVKPAPVRHSSPVRIMEVAEAPVANDIENPRRSPWLIGAPIAIVAIITALWLGPKMFSHKPEPAPSITDRPETPERPEVPETKETKPAATPAQGSSQPEDPIRHRVMPEVSSGTKRKIHGTLKVSVHVDVDQSGKVIAAKVTSPSSSRYFNNLAQETAQQWEFAPPQQNGEPVPSAWQLRFQFSRRSTAVVPSRIAQQ
jgi:TonB family protein